jgi:hypothetical protein
MIVGMMLKTFLRCWLVPRNCGFAEEVTCHELPASRGGVLVQYEKNRKSRPYMEDQKTDFHEKNQLAHARGGTANLARRTYFSVWNHQLRYTVCHQPFSASFRAARFSLPLKYPFISTQVTERSY